jgi:hypothetical protein
MLFVRLGLLLKHRPVIWLSSAISTCAVASRVLGVVLPVQMVLLSNAYYHTHLALLQLLVSHQSRLSSLRSASVRAAQTLGQS